MLSSEIQQLKNEFEIIDIYIYIYQYIYIYIYIERERERELDPLAPVVTTICSPQLFSVELE